MLRLGWASVQHTETVLVYIAEAHASDEWPLGRHVRIRQHRALEDRVAAAEGLRARVNEWFQQQQEQQEHQQHQHQQQQALQELQELQEQHEQHEQQEQQEQQCAPLTPRVLVDPMDDGFTRAFAAHPLRWYVFSHRPCAREVDVDSADALHAAGSSDDTDIWLDFIANTTTTSSSSGGAAADMHAPIHKGGYNGYELQALAQHLGCEIK